MVSDCQNPHRLPLVRAAERAALPGVHGDARLLTDGSCRRVDLLTQCTAKSKRSGQRCRDQAMHGSNVCYHHGGKSLKGIASPSLKTGRYSKYIPARMLDRYEASADDPELLNLRHDIALVDGRLADLLTRVDTNEARTLWEDVRKSHDEMKAQLLNEDYGGLMVALDKLDRSVGTGLADYDAWNEIEKLLEQRRKLAESEQKRLVAAQQMISSEQALTFVAALLGIIKDNVSDRQTLNKIQTSVNDLLTRSETRDRAIVG